MKKQHLYCFVARICLVAFAAQLAPLGAWAEDGTYKLPPELQGGKAPSVGVGELPTQPINQKQGEANPPIFTTVNPLNPAEKAAGGQQQGNQGKPVAFKGVPPLCGERDGKKGLGFAVANDPKTWPVADDQKFLDQAKKFGGDNLRDITERSRNIHAKLSPEISKFIDDYSYGFFGDKGAIVVICHIKAQAAHSVNQFKIASSKLGNANACGGSFNSAKNTYNLSISYYKKLETGLSHTLAGGKGPKGNTITGQRERFKIIQDNCFSQSAKLAAADREAVKADCKKLVGMESAKNQEPNGIFAQQLAETEVELLSVRESLKNFEKENVKFKEREEGCKKLAGSGEADVAGKKAGAQKAPPKGKALSGNEKITGGKGQGGGKGNGAKDKAALAAAGGGAAGGGAAAAARAAANPDPNAPGNEDVGGNGPPPQPEPPPAPESEVVKNLRAENDDLRNQLANRPTVPNPPPIPPEVSAAANNTASFLKDNWVWLAGGAAVAGGGYYLYQKDKKEKEKAAWYADDTNWMPYAVAARNANNAGSGGSSTPPPPPLNTNTPPGSRLVITTPINGASTGQAMSPVTIVIVDPNGVQLANTGTAINVSCLSPQPCSLKGGLQASTVNGTVTFSNLIFNQPDKGVKLQFSAQGFPAVTTPGSFDVQGDSPRQ